MSNLCPSCFDDGISFRGSKNSKYLIIFTKPYIQSAVKTRKDSVTGLDVLRKEFAKVGLDMQDFRLSWLWLHEPTKNENCYNAGRDLVSNEAKGKEVVILVGSEPVEEFTRYSVSDVVGLWVESAVLSAPVFVLPKPEGVFAQGAGIGELRLACQKLAKVLNND